MMGVVPFPRQFEQLFIPLIAVYGADSHGKVAKTYAVTCNATLIWAVEALCTRGAMAYIY